MAKYRIETAKLRAKFRDVLPDTFKDWCEHLKGVANGRWGWFSVKPANIKGLVPSPLLDVLFPFIELPDGSAVAIWNLQDSSMPIAHVSHDGKLTVIASTWQEFLRRWELAKTGVDDIDDRESKDAPCLSRGTKLQTHGTLTKKLQALCKSKQTSSTKLRTNAANALGEFLFAFAKKKRLLKSDLDIVNIVVTLTLRTYKVQWYNGGLKDFPWPNELHAALQEWVSVLGRSLQKSELSIWADGNVFFEKKLYLRRAGAQFAEHLKD